MIKRRKSLVSKLVFLAVCTSLAVSTTAFAAEKVSATDKPASYLVTSDQYPKLVEGEVQVALKENSSTGYIWQYNNIDNIIEEVSKNYISDSTDPNPPPGCGGTKIWTFKGIKEGSSTITFKNLRPWNDDTIDVRTFRFTVDKDLKVTVKEITANALIGDVNDDGKLSILDCIELNKYLSNPAFTIDKINGDVNGDGQINLKDLIELRKLL